MFFDQMFRKSPGTVPDQGDSESCRAPNKAAFYSLIMREAYDYTRETRAINNETGLFEETCKK